MSLNKKVDGENIPVNIFAATEVLERARAGKADRDEINETIAELQNLQRIYVEDPVIQQTLTGLIDARG
ncbi:MAG: hypothetical protein A3D65_06805 [Candidatus Lloydbacteria bacterium RIFCSPHIGHO2_02_FULL_50_13]|uniref:Uncharacterized protein n=1 Tax=Candidatus Lloydbacteria bacterium RIFCSPHIGHO2_02_FULL_50_13 TaxID=1798661 RepID=A0A1G2D1R0_9BACT|nr:MAG: hypothetical protein A3D65_06805 [Candidatus Lloydbacteria bacterium RIFCSPHIGHO2_02_FULL_50_13]